MAEKEYISREAAIKRFNFVESNLHSYVHGRHLECVADDHVITDLDYRVVILDRCCFNRDLVIYNGGGL